MDPRNVNAVGAGATSRESDDDDNVVMNAHFPGVALRSLLAALLVTGCGVGSITLTQLPDATDDGGVGGGTDAGLILSDARAITAFSFLTADNTGFPADVAGTISGTSIALTLPAGTALTRLVPTLAFEGALVPANKTAQDFTHPVSYTVTADDGASTTYEVTVTVTAPTCQPSASGCTLDVYNRAVAFVASHPNHSGPGDNWDGWCGALMVQFGNFGAPAPSAIDAYHHSNIVSTDPTAAPIGAFHYWDIGADGHVGVDLMGQGAVVLMASAHLAESWNPYIGVNSVGAYGEATGARYLGWSMDYNGNGQQLSGGGTCGAASVPAGCTLPRTPTETSGVPDVAFVMLLQRYAADHGYTGPINGKPNAATWAGVQTGLQAHGYSGPTNGLPATQTYSAFQRVAASYGYGGPIDGSLGPNSFRGFARFLNQTY
jgi:hypothetical protein